MPFVQLSDFDFDLPDALIAQQPRPRGGSRLLVVDRESNSWQESTVSELARWLSPGDVLVANDSKVFPARLLGRRAGGGRAECLLLERIDSGEAAPSKESTWLSLVNPGQRLPVGAVIDFSDDVRVPGIGLRGHVVGRTADGRRELKLVSTGIAVEDALYRLGHVPLPPYIKRADTDEDWIRYQTMFARHEGSIAAPTAGLHFDEALLASLVQVGVAHATVTLHVGYGTFKPVTATDLDRHTVDAERWEVTTETASLVNAARVAGGRVVAVGTTTTRTLESAVSVDGRLEHGSGSTTLTMVPGYRFRVVDRLLTNFHLPKSSLLLLVCAFAGRDLVLRAYRDAIARGFAFYSYGDAMLIR